MSDSLITNEDRGLTIRHGFLKYPGEAPEVDYKDAVKLATGDPFSLKLVKHILGMANAGGGYIVIGYKENNQKKPEPVLELPSEIAGSYDVSTLAQFVESYKSGSEKLDLLVHKDAHPETGTIYPIIEVRGFTKRPFFCKSTAGDLKQGALYLRIASARTVEVASPDEWDQLIDICVKNRQDEVLKRFGDLLKEVGPFTFPNKPSKADNSMDIERYRNEVQKIANEHSFTFEGLEVFHKIVGPTKTWNQKQLLDAAEKSALRNTGWPMGVVLHNRAELKPKPEPDGIKTIIVDQGLGFDYWNLNSSGTFYLTRSFEEDTRERPKRADESNRIMQFDIRIWRIAEAIKHCITLYQNLEGFDPTNKIHLEINHLGIQQRQLTASNQSRAMSMFKRESSTQNVYWQKDLSWDALNSDYENIVSSVAKELFLMFDFFELGPNIIEGVIKEFQTSRL